MALKITYKNAGSSNETQSGSTLPTVDGIEKPSVEEPAIEQKKRKPTGRPRGPRAKAPTKVTTKTKVPNRFKHTKNRIKSIAESIGTVEGVGLEEDTPVEGVKSQEYLDSLEDADEYLALYDHREKVALVHKMMLRRIPPSLMAQRLGCHINLVYRYVKEVREYVSLEAKGIDIPKMLGETLEINADIRSEALRLVSSKEATRTEKIKACNLVLQAERDKVSFLKECGMFHQMIIERLVKVMAEQINSSSIEKDTVDHMMSGLAMQLMTRAKESIDQYEVVTIN